MGVGIDVLEIDRLERALARRPKLAERLFTPAERAACEDVPRPAPHLAARFAAKEAVVKALALEEWSPQEIEITGGRGGPPGVRLHGRAAARAAELGGAVEISLTHSRGMAAAVAVLR